MTTSRKTGRRQLKEEAAQSRESLTHEIVWLPIDEVGDAWWNPNKETAEKFNVLFESVQDLGFIDVIQVIPIDTQALEVFNRPEDQLKMLGIVSQREFDSLYKEAKQTSEAVEANFASTQQELEHLEAVRAMLHDLMKRYGSDLPYQFMSFMMGTWTQAAVHTYVKLSKDAVAMLAKVKEFCRQEEVDINQVLMYGWRAALGNEENWPAAVD